MQPHLEALLTLPVTRRCNPLRHRLYLQSTTPHGRSSDLSLYHATPSQSYKPRKHLLPFRGSPISGFCHTIPCGRKSQQRALSRIRSVRYPFLWVTPFSDTSALPTEFPLTPPIMAKTVSFGKGSEKFKIKNSKFKFF